MPYLKIPRGSSAKGRAFLKSCGKTNMLYEAYEGVVMNIFAHSPGSHAEKLREATMALVFSRDFRRLRLYESKGVDLSTVLSWFCEKDERGLNATQAVCKILLKNAFFDEEIYTHQLYDIIELLRGEMYRHEGSNRRRSYTMNDTACLMNFGSGRGGPPSPVSLASV